MALPIDTGQWQRLSPLLDEGLALPPSLRAAWLQARTADQADLLPLLQELMADGPGLDWQLPTLDGAPAEVWQAGQTVGGYRLVHPIARGGMGSVWLARRDDLPRPVALKLPLGWQTSPALAERMARERDLLATLAHPHIAALYDTGLTGTGQPFLALEFVAGERIDLHCSARGLDVPARLRLFLQVAQAVAHAHSKLIVHRDLKPSNLLVDTDGQVKLLDFGIAKLLEAGVEPGSAPLTRAGIPPMTPEYAAPEQLAGLAVDTRADIYALGVVLFEMLTGMRPYRMLRATAAAVEDAVLNQLPARPSEVVRDRNLSRALRGDLDTIVAKALKKDPAERYATVQALADDIDRHLAHRPVLARPDSLGYVLRRLMRRHRVRFAAAGLALVGVMAGASLAAWQAHRAELERERATAVSDFFSRLLRDASPYRAAAADWRTQRLLVRLLRGSAASGVEVQQVSAVDLLRQAARQLDGQALTEPETRAQLTRLVAEGLAAFGDLPRAQTLAQRALDEARQRLGDRHPQTLRVRLSQILVGRYQGAHEQVAQDLAQLLPLLRAQGSSDPESLIVGLQLQAVQALDQGAPARGVAAVEEAVSWLHLLAPDHAERVAVATLQSRAYRLAGRRQDSFDAAGQAATLAERLFGAAPHPSRIESRVEQARAMTELGDPAEAVRHYEAALAEARRLVGNDSPLIAVLMLSVVPLDLDLGADERADRRSAEALGLVARHLRPGIYAHDAALLTRAQLLLARGRPGEALPLAEAALPTLRRVFGERHRHVQAAELCRLQALLQGGQPGAFEAARQGLAAIAPLSGAQAGATAVEPGGAAPDEVDATPLALRKATLQATMLRSQGDAAGAVRLLQPLVKATEGERRWRRDRALAQAELATALDGAGQPAASRQAWQRVLDLSATPGRELVPLVTRARAALQQPGGGGG